MKSNRVVRFVHPELSAFHRRHLWITGVLLVILAVPLLLDRFGASRTLLVVPLTTLIPGWARAMGREKAAMTLALLIVSSCVAILAAAWLADGWAIPRLRGARRVPPLTEYTTVLPRIALTTAIKGAELRLIARRFLPDGPPPEPGCFQLSYRRPVGSWISDSFELPILGIQIKYEEGPEGIAVRASLRPKVRFTSIDRGDQEYHRALMEHIVTGFPLRAIEHLDSCSLLTLQASWVVAATLAGRLWGLLPPFPYAAILLGVGIFSILGLAGAATQFWRFPHTSGHPFACAVALLMPCAAALLRAFA